MIHGAYDRQKPVELNFRARIHAFRSGFGADAEIGPADHALDSWERDGPVSLT